MNKSSTPDLLRRTICGMALAAPFLPLTQTAFAASKLPADPRSGSVRIYVSLATSAMTKLVKQLGQHFPNMKIEFVRAGSVETVKRFVAERQAGLVNTDLIHGADPGGFDYFAQQGWIDGSIVTPALTKDYRDGFYDKKAGWVAMRATGIAIMYNTKNVKKADLPKTWKELADPKWKSRIAISDPNRAGPSFSYLYAMWKMYGPDYLKAFGANDVMVAGDGSATREAIASGERDIAPVSEYDAFEFKKEGKPVDIDWPADGTVLLPAPLALVKGSKNADNAKALAAYLLSQEGQEMIATTTETWSARRDVGPPAGKPPIDAIKTIGFDWTKAAAEKSTVLNLYFQDFQGN
ncbi:MAG TPA: extracellular solute-binding protein [Stellaceae bacterium]|nr:extracellular solute-binding protein [Stellaceae bacterium]